MNYSRMQLFKTQNT